MNQNDIFTDIINKKIHTNIVLENDFFLAINDIAPIAPIHILLIPKKKYINFHDFAKNATQQYYLSLFTSIIHIIEKKKIINFKIVTNNGAEAGQNIFYFHIHIISGSKKILI